jgi:hypothetical protein
MLPAGADPRIQENSVKLAVPGTAKLGKSRETTALDSQSAKPRICQRKSA